VGAQLVQRALAGDPPRVLQTPREPVALALQLREAEQPRAAERVAALRDGEVGGDMRKAGGDDLRKLALELRHLGAQRATCRSLVERLDG
jgi:hypothetical protein